MHAPFCIWFNTIRSPLAEQNKVTFIVISIIKLPFAVELLVYHKQRKANDGFLLITFT